MTEKRWKGCPGVFEAIGNEKTGLLLKGIWLEEETRSKAKGFPNETLHFEVLMVIVGIKGIEMDPSEWEIKARIVFSGDTV